MSDFYQWKDRIFSAAEDALLEMIIDYGAKHIKIENDHEKVDLCKKIVEASISELINILKEEKPRDYISFVSDIIL